jgi:hypothetical protein
MINYFNLAYLMYACSQPMDLVTIDQRLQLGGFLDAEDFYQNVSQVNESAYITNVVTFPVSHRWH